MLQLGSKTFEIDGVTVYCDSERDDQYYYLSSRVQFDRRPDGSEAFTFMKWKNAAPGAVKGGGFLNFQSVVKLAPQTRSKILGRLRTLAPHIEEFNLAPAPIEGGTVRCIALNLEGSGGTSAEPPPPGAFNPVTRILGAVKPSLSGEETAAFSLVLDPPGAVILEKAFEQGTTPVGVVYDLQYSGLTPDLRVEIKADLDVVYNHFSANLEAQIYWVRVGIDAAFEQLRQQGAIEVKVIDFDNAPDRAEREKWALDFFKQDLLSKWFEPSLDLGKVQGPAQAEGLDAVLDRAKKLKEAVLGKDAGAAKDDKGGKEAKPGGVDGAVKRVEEAVTAASNAATSAATAARAVSAAAGEGSGSTKPANVATPPTATGGPQVTPPPAVTGTATPPAAALPAAALSITGGTPAPLPAGRSLSLLPGATGTTETLELRGGAGATVSIGGQVRVLDGNGRVTVDVAPGTSHSIAVDWPASPPVDETFSLFFTFDQPRESGFSATTTNPLFRSYLQNAPAPADERFSQSTAPGRVPPPAGGDALRDWLDNRLVEPKEVVLTAHASFENDSSTDKTILNQRLSERRLAIARGLIANRATLKSAEALGFQRAKNLGHVGREADRVVEITGKVAGKEAASSLRATLARAAVPKPPPATTPPVTTPPATTPPTGTPPPVTTPPATTTPPTGTTPPATTPPPKTGSETKPSVPTATAEGGTPALVSFRLKFLRQEERKQLTLVYDRKKAVKRTHAPQGFLGLLLDELEDKSKHFVEIDLDHPFFRVLTIDIATPVDFAKVGLFSTDVSIDYGDPASPEDHRRGEFQLTPLDRGPKRFETFLNSRREIDFRVLVQHHFEPNSGWIGEKLSYEIPARLTTDRTLNVDPGDALGFLELQIFPNRIDPGTIESTEVVLEYDDGATFRRRDSFRVLPNSAPQFWRLRLTRPDRRQWRATFTHQLKNGRRITAEPIVSDSSLLPVDDPFEGALQLLFVPVFAPGTVQRAFVDVEYNDPANQHRRDERLELSGDAVDPVPLRIALLNPQLRTFRHRITLITEQGGVIQRAPVDGVETLISVGLDA